MKLTNEKTNSILEEAFKVLKLQSELITILEDDRKVREDWIHKLEEVLNSARAELEDLKQNLNKL